MVWDSKSEAKAAWSAPRTQAEILSLDEQLCRAHARATWVRHNASAIVAAEKARLSDMLLADTKRAARVAHGCGKQRSPDPLSTSLRSKFVAVRVTDGDTWADVGRAFHALANYLADQLEVLHPGWVNRQWLTRKIDEGFPVAWVDTTPVNGRSVGGTRVPGGPTQ